MHSPKSFVRIKIIKFGLNDSLHLNTCGDKLIIGSLFIATQLISRLLTLLRRRHAELRHRILQLLRLRFQRLGCGAGFFD